MTTHQASLLRRPFVRGPMGRRPLLIATITTLITASVGFAPASATDDYAPAGDLYSMARVAQRAGAEKWWDEGYTGAGIDVAVIDTGVSPVEGIDGAGKVVNGIDLSLESQNKEFRYLDTNGHGTFMAGLIAGHGSALEPPYSTAGAARYRGIAPDARIVNVKVASADGGTDVSQIIAAIAWVVQHRRDRDLDIRVINLSFGTNSRQSSLVDPLAFAVEQAWQAGIVVVAAAGNTGFQRGNNAPGLADPAYDPFVIAVGGYDSSGTNTPLDDSIGAWSASASCGTCRKPDVIAEAAHLQGLRVRGSYLDLNHPEGILNSRYFRGSGTSEAAAIVAGSAALILDKYPDLTPDEVKAFLLRSSPRIDGVTTSQQGKGEVDLAGLTRLTPEHVVQTWTPSTGDGSLEASRGTDHLTRDGVVLQGEQDIFGHPFNSARMARLEAAHESWDGGVWNGNSWSGNSWSGNSWSGSSWSGNSWSGNSWSGNSWSGNSWSGNSWSGNSWSGTAWATGLWS